MTDSERSTTMKALKSVFNAVKEIEQQTNRQILRTYCAATISGRDSVFFTGYNDVEYNIPLELFLRLPQKRVVIEVARALTIDTNDYGII